LYQTKEIGNRYKSISADEKAKWQAKADAAKEVYKSDLAKYKKTMPDAPKKPKAKSESKTTKPDPAQESSEDDSDSDSGGSDNPDSDDDSD